MFGGITGISGLSGVEAAPPMQGRDPSNFGTGPQPGHDVPGDQSADSHELYQGTRHPVPESLVDEDGVDSTPPGGRVLDETPVGHAAPYPRGLTHDPLISAQQSQMLHGLDLGGTRRQVEVGLPYEFHVEGGTEDSPNASILAAVPGQLRTGTDVDQGFGSTPGYGFAFGKLLRRVFKDPVPIDRTGTVHGERPFLGAHPLNTPRPYGDDSPYGEASEERGMRMGPTPSGPPTPYMPAPEPEVSATDYAREAGFSNGWVLG